MLSANLSKSQQRSIIEQADGMQQSANQYVNRLQIENQETNTLDTQIYQFSKELGQKLSMTPSANKISSKQGRIKSLEYRLQCMNMYNNQLVAVNQSARKRIDLLRLEKQNLNKEVETMMLKVVNLSDTARSFNKSSNAFRRQGAYFKARQDVMRSLSARSGTGRICKKKAIRLEETMQSSYFNSTKNSYIPTPKKIDLEEIYQCQRTEQKLLEAWKEKVGVLKNKLHSYEQGVRQKQLMFEHIQYATGISQLDALVNYIENSEAQEDTLHRYMNKLSNDIDEQVAASQLIAQQKQVMLKAKNQLSQSASKDTRQLRNLYISTKKKHDAQEQQLKRIEDQLQSLFPITENINKQIRELPFTPLNEGENTGTPISLLPSSIAFLDELISHLKRPEQFEIPQSAKSKHTIDLEFDTHFDQPTSTKPMQLLKIRKSLLRSLGNSGYYWKA